MFVGKARAYLSEAPDRCPISGMFLALPTKIRLGWKVLPGTNALAYCTHLQITAVKRFITLAQNVTKPFWSDLQF